MNSYICLRNLWLRSVVAAAVLALMCGSASARADQVGDAFIVFNVQTGELRLNPGNAGISQGNGIGSYLIRPNPAVIQFSSTATQFSYPSGDYLFAPTLGNVTLSDDNTIGAAFYTLTSPNVSGTADYFSRSNLLAGTAAVAGSSGGTSWGPGTGGVFASEIPGASFGTNEWSFGTIGSTGMSVENALAAFGATTQGGFSTSTDMIYDIDGVLGEQNFRVYTVSVVPEPSTLFLAAAGGIVVLGGIAGRQNAGRTKRKHKHGLERCCAGTTARGRTATG